MGRGFLPVVILSLILFPAVFGGCGEKTSSVNIIDISNAPIHEISISIAESYPEQIMLYIKGGLADSCTTFRKIETEVNGDIITVTVMVQRPRDAVCAEVYSYFEKNVNLGSDFTSGKTYTVNVNDKSTEFTMP